MSNTRFEEILNLRKKNPTFPKKQSLSILPWKFMVRNTSFIKQMRTTWNKLEKLACKKHLKK